MDPIVIEIKSAAKVRAAISTLASLETVKTVLDAAGEEARVATLAHFRTRQAEPEKTADFPKFGKSFGKRGFWYGNRGHSVAEQVGAAELNTADASVTIRIASPALAHKADPAPPAITPKGGRKYIAIPANARAAAFAGMPRDFDPGGGMRFGYAATPDGHMLPALVAKTHHMRTVSRGKRAGQVVSGGKSTSGAGAPQYWLVRKVQTRHDPRALPDVETIATRAAARAASVLDRLFAKPGVTP